MIIAAKILLVWSCYYCGAAAGTHYYRAEKDEFRIRAILSIACGLVAAFL